MPAFLNRLFDGLSHLQLPRAELIGWMSAREQSAGRKELVE
jgi:hypothetical protein